MAVIVLQRPMIRFSSDGETIEIERDGKKLINTKLNDMEYVGLSSKFGVTCLSVKMRNKNALVIKLSRLRYAKEKELQDFFETHIDTISAADKQKNITNE